MDDLEKKREIARENGKKSHGPITPEGKQRSSLNGITHGLASKCVVLANESQQAYDELFAAFHSEWQPASVTETTLLTEMVNSYWRLRRIWSMETALFDTEMFCQKEDFEAAWSNYHSAMRVTDALCGVHIANPATLETLHRYEVRYDRIYKSSMDHLIKLRRLRHAPEIAPTPLRRPEPSPDLPPAPDPQQDQSLDPQPQPPATWLTRFLALVLSLLAALRTFSRPRKTANQALKSTPLQTKPSTLPEFPLCNFHLPEFFFWLSLFTPTPARKKAEPLPPLRPRK
ncbi:MAG: hypothetical protein IT165_21050 [Bryobacterales bacterium]|nr:hypothetical protein [Bryobacterales bacterium]